MNQVSKVFAHRRAGIRGCLKSGTLFRAATVRKRSSRSNADCFLTGVALKWHINHPLSHLMFATDCSRWFKTLQSTPSRLQPDFEYESHRLSDRALIRTIYHDRSIKDGDST